VNAVHQPYSSRPTLPAPDCPHDIHMSNGPAARAGTGAHPDTRRRAYPTAPRSRPAGSRLSRECRGQILFQLALLTPLLLALLGLVADGGLAYARYRRAQNAVDLAAQAAAQEIDTAHFIQTNQVRLSASRATATGWWVGWANGQGGAVRITSVEVTLPRTVRVVGQTELPTLFMQALGFPDRTITVVGEAHNTYGIRNELP